MAYHSLVDGMKHYYIRYAEGIIYQIGSALQVEIKFLKKGFTEVLE